MCYRLPSSCFIEALRETPPTSIEALESAILHHTSEGSIFSTSPLLLRRQLPGLRSAFTGTPLTSQIFLREVLPRVKGWALEAPVLFSERAAAANGWTCGALSIPLLARRCLDQGDDDDAPVTEPSGLQCVALNRLQARCLLAHIFLCTLPDSPAGGLGNSMWSCYASNTPIGTERVKCLLAYFHHEAQFNTAAATEAQSNNVVFERVGTGGGGRELDWSSMANTPLCDMVISATERIEDIDDAELHVDFANRDLHIHRIIPSCTQEEILFSIKPELFCGMLLATRMEDDEVIFMHGARQYSDYTGYLFSFEFQPLEEGRGRNERPPPSVVAMDALMNHGRLQWETVGLRRDLLKAFLGFGGWENRDSRRFTSVSSGNWGCGVFAGHPLLKYLQQWMAASAAGVERVFYSTFRDEALLRRTTALRVALKSRGATVADVWGLIHRFSETVGGASFDSFLEAELQVDLLTGDHR